MIRQRTLQKVVRILGVGLHSGEQVSLNIHPAPSNTGIIFRRTDISPVPHITAQYDKVDDARLCTSLQQDGVKIGTIEHLMSAFSGLGIDNAYVDVDGIELPIMDGSAAPFVKELQLAGIQEQEAPKRFIRILNTIRVEDGDKYVQLSPYEGFKVVFTIDFKHPYFVEKPKTLAFQFSGSSYIEEISNARTFGFLSDYEQLKACNLAKGGSLENAIVVDDNGIMNEGGLRFDAEFIAHKILDAIGDLYLLGHGLLGVFEGHKSGHALNNRLLRELMMRPNDWEYVSFEDSTETPVHFSTWWPTTSLFAEA
ncbi:MAG: UDP-3-O-acyl-N-acetylglucosamine deacetylase [Legionellaceae bacterium]|nr:UDP-3-O-acyl-N-acetylglucosamine deacetylase [Legionellaceae bacterium]